MKFLLSVLLSLTLFTACDQKYSSKKTEEYLITDATCHCDKDATLAQIISCNPKSLDNQAKLYWNYNCDSSWITFENKKGDRKIIFTLGKELLELTNKIGHTKFEEFKSTFLYTNSVISGCCDPEDYYLYDKASGNLIKKLGRTIYISDNINIPFVISVTNSNYDEISKLDYNSLTIYNLDNGKEFKFPLKDREIRTGMENNKYMFPEDVFETVTINDEILTIKYHTEKYIKGNKIHYKVIKIDLKNYRS